MCSRPTRAAFRRPSGPRSTGAQIAEAIRGPPCAFAPLQRSISATPHRTLRPDGSAPDASSPELSRPTTRSRSGGSAGYGGLSRAATCHVRGLATPIAASTTVPTGARSAGASMGFTLRGLTASRRRPSRNLCPRDVSASTHPPKRAGEGTRLQGLLLATKPETGPLGPIPEPPWASSLQSIPSRRPGSRFRSRCRPSHPWKGIRVSPSGSQGIANRRDRLVRLRTAGSPGISHLPTVTALRTSSRGTGSWFRLAQPRTCARASRS